MSLHPTHPWIDSAHAPVYHLTYPAYDPADPRQLAKYTSAQTELYTMLSGWTKARRRAYGFTIDLRQVRSTALGRQRVVHYMEQVRQRGSPYLACRAYIAPNDELKGILTALFWHSPPDYPHQVFGSVEEARAWALKQTLALDVLKSRAVGT